MFKAIFEYVLEVIAEAVASVKRIFVKEPGEEPNTFIGIVDEQESDTVVIYSTLGTWLICSAGFFLTGNCGYMLIGLLSHLTTVGMSRVRWRHRK